MNTSVINLVFIEWRSGYSIVRREKGTERKGDGEKGTKRKGDRFILKRKGDRFILREKRREKEGKGDRFILGLYPVVPARETLPVYLSFPQLHPQTLRSQLIDPVEEIVGSTTTHLPE